MWTIIHSFVPYDPAHLRNEQCVRFVHLDSTQEYQWLCPMRPLDIYVELHRLLQLVGRKAGLYPPLAFREAAKKNPCGYAH